MKSKYIQKRPNEFITNSESETILFAAKIADDFKGNEVVLLVGDLGSGKTVFVKGIAKGLGLEDIHQVCSPSYPIMNIYTAKYPIYHIDLYRLDNKSEILDLGWEDYIGNGVVIVEWGEKIQEDFEGIHVAIEIGKHSERIIKISI